MKFHHSCTHCIRLCEAEGGVALQLLIFSEEAGEETEAIVPVRPCQALATPAALPALRAALAEAHNLQNEDAGEAAQLTASAQPHAVGDAAYNDELLAEVTWLKDMLFPRLVSLMERGEYVSPLVHWRAPHGEELVNMHHFAARYQALKDKYAAMLFEASLAGDPNPEPAAFPLAPIRLTLKLFISVTRFGQITLTRRSMCMRR